MDAKLPLITLSGALVKIEQVRNFSWKSETEYDVDYIEREFLLSDIEKVYYIITPFSEREWPAHTMISFDIKDQEPIVFSAEIRKEKWESFDAFKGILNQFELMYLFSMEEDIIKLRTNYRKNEVYMYPIAASSDWIQNLFVSIINRTQELAVKPEFYNTILNNCTTNLLDHVNKVLPKSRRFFAGKYTFLPSYSDTLLYDNALIDNRKENYQATREFYRIDMRAREMAEWDNFSQAIRDFGR